MNKTQKITLLISALILLIPLIAMQFTNEVNWNILDFLVAFSIFSFFGLIGEYTSRKISTIKFRIPILVTIFIALVLVWAELSVGIIGSPIAGN